MYGILNLAVLHKLSKENKIFKIFIVYESRVDRQRVDILIRFLERLIIVALIHFLFIFSAEGNGLNIPLYR